MTPHDHLVGKAFLNTAGNTGWLDIKLTLTERDTKIWGPKERFILKILSVN